MRAAEFLVQQLAADPSSPSDARAWARHILSTDFPDEDFSIELDLDRIYDTAVVRLDSLLRSPEEDLARCVSVDAFVSFYANADTRAEWGPIPEAFSAYITESADPAEALQATLEGVADPLIDRRSSWFVPLADVVTKNAWEMRQLLRLSGLSPYVVLKFPLINLVRHGIRVRPPTRLDTIPSRDYGWHEESVPGELVDLDIPPECLGGVEWKI